ncbi:MAG TPA: Hpt domain-containing protein, partial [Polyangiaceae bacterium]|nr:Hpt domain-containing protein [Polyangiaceae bacterium]
MDEITEEFLAESLEAVDQLDRDLVSLEAAPGEKEVLSRIFRALHTIKGTCGFLGFDQLERVTHAGEGLLSRLRDGELSVTEDIAGALLATVDAIRQMLESIQTHGKDGDLEYADLVTKLKHLTEGAPVAATESTAGSGKPKKRAAKKPPARAPLSLVPAAAGTAVVAPAASTDTAPLVQADPKQV